MGKINEDNSDQIDLLWKEMRSKRIEIKKIQLHCEANSQQINNIFEIINRRYRQVTESVGDDKLYKFRVIDRDITEKEAHQYLEELGPEELKRIIMEIRTEYRDNHSELWELRNAVDLLNHQIIPDMKKEANHNMDLLLDLHKSSNN